jgi:IS30 family transposase
MTLKDLNQVDVMTAVRRLNTRPRKTLGYSAKPTRLELGLKLNVLVESAVYDKLSLIKVSCAFNQNIYINTLLLVEIG